MRYPVFPSMPRGVLVLGLCSLLAACGGNVAQDAPALLSQADLAARTNTTTDTMRGARAASELAYRAQRLRARAHRLRTRSLDGPELMHLLRRADELRRQ